MKKTYIKPENIVVHLNVERMMCQSAEVTSTTSAQTAPEKFLPSDMTVESGTFGLAREVIQAPDPWDNEW